MSPDVVPHPIIDWPPRIGPFGQFYRVSGGVGDEELRQPRNIHRYCFVAGEEALAADAARLTRR